MPPRSPTVKGGRGLGCKLEGGPLSPTWTTFWRPELWDGGGGANNPQIGDLLGAGVGNPGVWFGVGDSSDFLAAFHLDEATFSLLRDSFVSAHEDPSLADSGHSPRRKLLSCRPSFNTANPSDTSLPYRDFPPFALNLLEGIKTFMGAPPTFEVEGTF